MHQNCCKSRYHTKHSCNTSLNQPKTSLKSTIEDNKLHQNSDLAGCTDMLKAKDDDVTFFGSILQFQVIFAVYIFLGYIIRSLFKSCIQKQTQSPCYSKQVADSTFSIKNCLETCLCSRYYFNLFFIYLILIQLVTAVLLWRDRERAARQQYRVWPCTHWLIAFAGGIPTSWLFMYLLRFKICVPKYYYTAIFLTIFNLLWPIFYIMFNLK